MSEWTRIAPTQAGRYWNKGGSYKRGGLKVLIKIYVDDEIGELGCFSERADEFCTCAELGGLWWTTPVQAPD